MRPQVRLLIAAAVLMGALAAVLPVTAGTAGAAPACDHRVLILSAMPLELNPLVAQTKLDPNGTVRVDKRTFYSGRLAGVDVELALTGIGPVNANQTATTAFEHFRCPFAAAVFSGVAGSPDNVGDVTIPQQWTSNNGRYRARVDAAMFNVAQRLQGTVVKLSQDLPVGDAACLCGGPKADTPVHLPQQTRVRVGGVGDTSDPFGGHAAPCTFGGGDIAGCEPCILTGDAARDTANFADDVPDLPGLVAGLFAPAPPTLKGTVAQDEETWAVNAVARKYDVPFLGIRAVSDGGGDPLHLPGFPSEFFVYRQLAGNNAAAVTVAFLHTWTAAGRPT